MYDDMFIDYDAAFIRIAHELLFCGYTRARGQFNSATDEEVISQYICECIENMLRFEDIPEEYEPFFVKNEPPVGRTSRIGNSRKEIDILISTTDPKLRPELIFEAKRLKTNEFYISNYVGDKGMMRFLNEDYAKHCPSAAMIGYMQSDNMDYWYTQLEEQFKKADQTALRIEEPLTQCRPSITQGISREWQSKHRRPIKPAILIYHIFLDCS